MTDRDKSTLECPEKMCDYCCNFDKEHIGMDGMALCKLTMTLAYAEDYGGNCMFYNVPKEQIIVPPVKVGQTVYIPWYWNGELGIASVEVQEINIYDSSNHCMFFVDMQSDDEEYNQSFGGWKTGQSVGKTVFLTKEEAEAKLKERTDNG